MIKRFAPMAAIATLLMAFGLPAAADAAPAGPDGPEATADTVTVQLSPIDDSGVRARARLVHGEEELSVAVSAAGVEAGSEYPAHIHQGSCESGGGVVAAVGPVTKASADARAGQAASTVALDKVKQAKEKAEGEHPGFFLQVHLPDGTPAACGDIEKDEKEKEEGEK